MYVGRRCSLLRLRERSLFLQVTHPRTAHTFGHCPLSSRHTFNENRDNKISSWYSKSPSRILIPNLSHPCCRWRVWWGVTPEDPEGWCQAPSAAGAPGRPGGLTELLCPSVNHCTGEAVLKYDLRFYFPSEKQWALFIPRHFSSRGLYFLLYPKTCGCQLSLVLPLYYDPLASAGIVDYVAFWISWLPWIIGQKGCQHFDFNCYN